MRRNASFTRLAERAASNRRYLFFFARFAVRFDFRFEATFDLAADAAFFLAGFDFDFFGGRADAATFFFFAVPFFDVFVVRDETSGISTALVAVPPPSFDRIASTAFLIGFLPLAEASPISAPATPPATAPTGPPTTPPMTAPVTPPAACFETWGRFVSLAEFLAIAFPCIDIE